MHSGTAVVVGEEEEVSRVNSDATSVVSTVCARHTTNCISTFPSGGRYSRRGDLELFEKCTSFHP